MKKNKLTDIRLNSVDLVNRGANQDANIALYKSDNTPNEAENNILKKAYDYLKNLFAEEPESVTKSDIIKEYVSYASQLCDSFDTVVEKDGINTEEKTAIMQKSVSEFADFMSMAIPVWASGCSVTKSNKLSEIIAKAETPVDNNKGKKREESDDMPLENLTPEEQATYKSLLEKMNGSGAPVKEEPTAKSDAPVVLDKPADDVTKSAVPEFITDAIKKSEEFIKAQELKDMKEVAKKYEVLGEKSEELGQHLYDLKKSDNALYETSIAMLDRQVEAIEKSGIFAEIGKSGAQGGGETDVVKKAEGMAAELRKSAPEMTREQALAQVWESNPDMMSEYMQNM